MHRSRCHLAVNAIDFIMDAIQPILLLMAGFGPKFLAALLLGLIRDFLMIGVVTRNWVSRYWTSLRRSFFLRPYH